MKATYFYTRIENDEKRTFICPFCNSKNCSIFQNNVTTEIEDEETKWEVISPLLKKGWIWDEEDDVVYYYHDDGGYEEITFSE